MVTSMQPYQPTSFIDGPTIRPADKLLEWLESGVTKDADGMKHLKLPVVIRFDQLGLGIGEAVIGTTDADFTDDAIYLELEDTAMSDPLWKKALQAAPKGAKTVTLWLQGQWGKLVDLPGLPMPELPGIQSRELHPFAVRQVLGVFNPAEDGTSLAVKIEG